MNEGTQIGLAIAAAGLMVLSIAWTILALRVPRGWPKFLGPAGALVAAALVALVGVPLLTPWFYPLKQLVLPGWMAAFGCLGFALWIAFDYPKPWRAPIAVCASLALLVAGWALLSFLWAATVSGGGV